MSFNCGSGFPAANHFIAGGADRGWKAAPTIHKLLNLMTFSFFHMQTKAELLGQDASIDGNDFIILNGNCFGVVVPERHIDTFAISIVDPIPLDGL